MIDVKNGSAFLQSVSVDRKAIGSQLQLCQWRRQFSHDWCAECRHFAQQGADDLLTRTLDARCRACHGDGHADAGDGIGQGAGHRADARQQQVVATQVAVFSTPITAVQGYCAWPLLITSRSLWQLPVDPGLAHLTGTANSGATG